MSQNGFKQQPKKLLAPRTLHDMVTLGSTCFLIGGTNDAGGTAAGAVANIDAATIFTDGSLGDFKTVGFLPAPRVQGDSLIVDGRFLVQLGGQDTGGTAQSTIYVTRVDNNGGIAPFRTFTFPKATMIGHRLAFARGYLYVIGGGATNNQEVYYSKMATDGSFGPWVQAVSLPAALAYPAAVSDEGGNVIYVSGGIVSTTVQDAIYRAFVNQDGTLSKWTLVGSMITPRWRHAAVLHNGYLYDIGGSPDNVANSALASCGFAKINSDWSLGKSIATGALFASIRNVEASLVPFFNLGRMVVCGGHLASGNNADTVNVGSIQGDGHL